MAALAIKRVHLWDGDKGGVGKSFCCRIFIQYLIDQKINFVPIEADRYNPDVSARYGNLPFQYGIFSEDERKMSADNIVELAKMEPVVISLPSQVGNPLNLWLEDAVDTAKEHNIQFVRWFVSSGAYESLVLFYSSLEKHGMNMPYVFVRNHGVGEEWDLEQIKGLPELVEKYQVQTIDIPKMLTSDRNLLDKNNLSFGEARTSPVFKSFSVSQDRIEKYLKKVYKSFESSGLVP